MLTIPSPADLAAYQEQTDAGALQEAADLFTIATDISEDPTDPLEMRIVRIAILEMAWYLQVNKENRESEFSPFNSERIGSYSYSKSYSRSGAVATEIANNRTTGVAGFDRAVEYFRQKYFDGGITIDSEWVFKPGYGRSQRQLFHDPSDATVPSLEGIPVPIPAATVQGDVTWDENGYPIITVGEDGSL